MVSLPEIRASNEQITESTTPRIAVFVGGTAGIGKATLTALVSKKTPIKVYIIGRDKASRKSWLESLQGSNHQAEIIWLDGQVTLLAEVKRLCNEIKRREDSIDLLFLSAGFLPFDSRKGMFSPFAKLNTSHKLEANWLGYRNFRRIRNVFGPPLLGPHPFHQPSAPSPYHGIIYTQDL
jgi:NAD(P)-dependent dehydrogenase (short-subunit alcohol dehydrogenase family)